LKKKDMGLNKYEGLMILNTAGKEEAEKDILDRIQKDIEQAGGRVETVQKMGSRPFARETNGMSAGYYANFIFRAPPKAISELDAKLHLDTEVFRWLFTEPIPEAPVREPRDMSKAKVEKS
jgi:small subunit ribosomal protein S6